MRAQFRKPISQSLKWRLLAWQRYISVSFEFEFQSSQNAYGIRESARAFGTLKLFAADKQDAHGDTSHLMHTPISEFCEFNSLLANGATSSSSEMHTEIVMTLDSWCVENVLRRHDEDARFVDTPYFVCCLKFKRWIFGDYFSLCLRFYCICRVVRRALQRWISFLASVNFE